ncbi:hypothetical protein [Pseudomonas aeruginosa]|uniref:hypothetical protein n=1 Tax=Pseudomonas aeruginosa TaxID=287 RepID=UPI003C05D192|nr:hypothetical protein [Pseudomonas aeruginosa]
MSNCPHEAWDFGALQCPDCGAVKDHVTDAEYAKLAAEAQALREEVAELRRDKARLDAIEDNCWDVRYGSSSNADAGDSSISIEIVGRYQGVPHIRVLGENYTRTCAPQSIRL